jgi:predicted flap endonuclease-1-like 5' DNA nuclease
MHVAYNARAPAIAHPFRPRLRLNGLTLVALIALAIGIVVAYRAGAVDARRRARRGERMVGSATPCVAASPPLADAATPHTVAAARVARAERVQLQAFAADRARLFADLAEARAAIARYRQIVVDIERNAPPPLLDAPGMPDDLKLIVGVGPVIERMLYQSGIASYRQIARLSEREIDAIDARLAEFRGRIRRDGWVTQARTLHLAKYGTTP